VHEGGGVGEGQTGSGQGGLHSVAAAGTTGAAGDIAGFAQAAAEGAVLGGIGIIMIALADFA